MCVFRLSSFDPMSARESGHECACFGLDSLEARLRVNRNTSLRAHLARPSTCSADATLQSVFDPTHVVPLFLKQPVVKLLGVLAKPSSLPHPSQRLPLRFTVAEDAAPAAATVT